MSFKTSFQQAINDLSSASEKRPEKAKLISAKRLKAIDNTDLRDFLSDLYKSDDAMKKLSATVFNAVFTETKATFLFSRPILEELLKSDKNVRRSTLNGSEYGDLWAYLTANNFFTVVRKSSKGVKAAAVLELAHKDLLSIFDQIVGEQFRKIQKQNCIDIFDTYIKTDAKTSKKTSNEGEGDIDTDPDNASKNRREGPFISSPVTGDQISGLTKNQASYKKRFPIHSVTIAPSIDPDPTVRLIEHTVSWAKGFKAIVLDVKRELFGKGKRRATATSFLNALESVGTDTSDPDAVAGIFKDVIFPHFVEIGKSDKDQLLVQECIETVREMTSVKNITGRKTVKSKEAEWELEKHRAFSDKDKYSFFDSPEFKAAEAAAYAECEAQGIDPYGEEEE